MQQFASGWKQSYYGKGDVTAYRLHRNGEVPDGKSPIFAANVLMLLYGDAFWPTYTTGDNSSLVATDSMKNFIQRETMNYPGFDLESYAQFLADQFLTTYPHAEGIQITAKEVPYAEIPNSPIAFAPSGPEHAMVRLELKRAGATWGWRSEKPPRSLCRPRPRATLCAQRPGCARRP